jgi:hypothetical protein
MLNDPWIWKDNLIELEYLIMPRVELFCRITLKRFIKIQQMALGKKMEEY